MKAIGYLFIFLFTSNLYCQNYVDIGNFYYSTTNQNSFKNSDEKSTIKNFHLNLSFPVELNTNTILLTGLNLDKASLKLDPLRSPDQLYLLGLELGVHKTLSDKWSGTFMVLPRLASDLINVGKRDFQFGVLALFANTKNENLIFKYGLYTINELYGRLYLPLLGFYYLNPSKTWEFNIMAPIKMTAMNHFSEKSSIGFKFDGIGNTYNLNSPISNQDSNYVTKTSNELFFIYEYKLNKSLLFSAHVGFSLFRHYKVFNARDKVDFSIASIYFGDDRNEINTLFNDGIIFKTSLTYRFHLN